MRRKLVATVTAMIMVGVAISAQSRPDFSGKWVMDPPPAAPAGDAGGGPGGAAGGGGFQLGYGAEFAVKQDATTLTISRGQGTPLVLKLDGTESKNTVTRNGQSQEQVSRATWDGNKLVVATEVNFQGNTGEQRRVLSLESGHLVIEQTNPGRNGGGPSKVIYKKG
jgi:hypothetical protein